GAADRGSSGRRRRTRGGILGRRDECSSNRLRGRCRGTAGRAGRGGRRFVAAAARRSWRVALWPHATEEDCMKRQLALIALGAALFCAGYVLAQQKEAPQVRRVVTKLDESGKAVVMLDERLAKSDV